MMEQIGFDQDVVYAPRIGAYSLGVFVVDVMFVMNTVLTGINTNYQFA